MNVTSPKNELVKQLARLRTRKGRSESGLHLIEGERLVFDALEAGMQPERVLVREGEEAIMRRLDEMGVPYAEASERVMAAVCDTETPQGVCASLHTPGLTPPAEYPKGLIVALDRLQDPGNLGTVIRTADAFGAAGVLIGEGTTDPYSPKALRAAMGSTYHIPIWQGKLPEELKRLRESGFAAVCGHLKGDETLPPLPENRVLVIGNEANGVSGEAAEGCILYRLPMRGRAESLNAAVFAAILIHKLSED